MNCINNFLDYLKKKKCMTICISLIALVCCITACILWYKADTIFPPFPKEVNVEAKRNRFAYKCKQYSCVVDWINRTGKNKLNLTEVGCKLKKGFVKVLNGTYSLYKDGKLGRSFIVGYYSYFLNYYCHRYCGVDGPFRYYPYYWDFNLQNAWARIQSVKCGTMNETYCRWWGYKWIFSNYFAYFSIPATFVFNFINLTTMRQLFLKHPGSAQHLHFAESFTDGLLNIVISLHGNLYFFHSLDLWRKTCGYYRFSSTFQFVAVVKRFVPFVNQAYLTGLILDRLYSLMNPYQYYNNMNTTKKKMKKRGRKIIFMVLFFSLLLYVPLFLWYTFSPTFLYWVRHSDFWGSAYDSIDVAMASFYAYIGFVPFVLQIIIGILVEKKFRKYTKNRTNNRNEKEMKKQERDKQMLLVGTIGLNLVTGVITGLSYLLFNEGFYGIIGVKRPWWAYPINMTNSILVFLNGNAAVIIHVALVSSYRKAFKETFIWRIMFTQTVVAPSQHDF